MFFMDIIKATYPKRLTSETNFSNSLLNVDASSKTPKLYGMKIFNTEEMMDTLYLFKGRFGKIDKFGWRYFEIVSVDADTQFTFIEFQDKCQTCVVQLTLTSLDY